MQVPKPMVFTQGGKSSSRVEIMGFDINQPSHVKLAQEALRNANGGTIRFGVGQYARD
jgi:hypothetical protein